MLDFLNVFFYFITFSIKELFFLGRRRSYLFSDTVFSKQFLYSKIGHKIFPIINDLTIMDLFPTYFKWRVRMWGKSPFERVTMNDLPVQSLQGNPNGFVYATTVRNGWNKLKIKYHSFAMKKKYLLMAQVSLIKSFPRKTFSKCTDFLSGAN